MNSMMPSGTNSATRVGVADIKHVHTSLQNCLKAMNKVLIGQEDVNKLALAGILAGGHVMLTGKPGLGKTELSSNLAHILGLNFKRVQGVSDLMPADILGSEHYDEHAQEFNFDRGPIFNQMLMFDEINRAPPKTQSALLQAMQEKEVTIRGEAVPLPKPFHVVATRNPIEQEGTYPLPEAQMDRFIMDIPILNTTAANEKEIVKKILAGEKIQRPEQVLDTAELITIQKIVREMPIGDAVLDGLVNVVRACRPDNEDASKEIKDNIMIDPSGSRAQASFAMAANALALIEGRFTASKADIKTLSHPILLHRMALTYPARARGHKLEDLIDNVCKQELGL